jgi:hypothetical protein
LDPICHQGFHTLSWSIDTCFRLMLGETEPYLDILTTANSTSGVVFYYVFMFVVFFILLNILLAILVDAYVTVKEEAEEGKTHTITEDIYDMVGDFAQTAVDRKRYGIPSDEKMKTLMQVISGTVVKESKELQREAADQLKRVTLKDAEDRTIELSFPVLVKYLQHDCHLDLLESTKLGIAIMTRYADVSLATGDGWGAALDEHDEMAEKKKRRRVGKSTNQLTRRGSFVGEDNKRQMSLVEELALIPDSDADGDVAVRMPGSNSALVRSVLPAEDQQVQPPNQRSTKPR